MILAAAILIIISGAIILFIGCFGCTGAWRESQCLLATFFAILLLITLLLITATVLAFTLPTAISLVVKPGLQMWMHSDDFSALNETRKAEINKIQEKLECCGASGPSSYGSVRPSSCFKNVTVAVEKSCADALREKFFTRSHAWALGGFGVLLILLLVIGMILSLLLCCAIRSKSDPEWSAVQSNDQEEGEKE